MEKEINQKLTPEEIHRIAKAPLPRITSFGSHYLHCGETYNLNPLSKVLVSNKESFDYFGR